MKLQVRTNLYNILYSGIILIFTGIFLEIALIRIFYKQVDESIRTEREIIEDEIENLDTVPDYSSIFGHQIEVTMVQHQVPVINKFSNTNLIDPKTDELIPYRLHYFSKNRLNGMGYTISILKPLTELQKFKKVVIFSILFTFIILLAAFLGSGYIVSRKLWHPFYKTLDEITHFNLDAPVTLNFSETGITEFKQLNQIITLFSGKLRRDFVRMQSFTENLSHEINTMLAIINSKVELILQSEDLSKDQIDHFKIIYEVTNNLIYLNNNLLLLAKIDNQFYLKVEKIKLSALIKHYLITYEDFIREKRLKVELNLDNTQVDMNPTLAGVLVSNIINNGIKHNATEGFLNISLINGMLKVMNTNTMKINDNSGRTDQYFQIEKPFKSLGIGLEIIRRICRIYKFSFSINQTDDLYQTEIGFQ